MHKTKKIIVLHNYITPVRNYYFNYLNDFFVKKGADFKVIFLSHSDKNRNWKEFNTLSFNYEVLKNFAIRVGSKDLFTFFINLNIADKLKKENPDIVICAGWDHFAAYYANYWCRKNNKKFILWSGSTAYEKSWRRTLFNPLVKYLVKRTQYFLAYGTRAKKYLEKLGGASKQIQILWNTCDLKSFSTYAKNHKKSDLKRELSLENKIVLLFNGQLIERKGVFELLESYKQLSQKHENLALIIIGKGQEQENMKQYIEENNLQNVQLLGHINYQELPKYYTLADVFILPSHEEVWGLVINEAMACGLPIVTNHAVGASVDLVKHGQNGYIMQKCTRQEISNGVEFILENNLIQKNQSSIIIQEFNLEKNINNLKII